MPKGFWLRLRLVRRENGSQGWSCLEFRDLTLAVVNAELLVPIPSIVLEGNRIVHVNGAARALGILPEEPAS